MGSRNKSASAVSGTTRSRRYWRRTETPKPWLPWGFAPLLGLVVLFLIGALLMAPRIEADVRGEVAERMQAAGIAATGVASDGQGVTIEAEAAGDQRVFIEALGESTRCDTWAGRLTCPTNVAVKLTEPQSAPAIADIRPHRFTVEKKGNAVLLSGEVPTVEEHDRLLQSAGRIFDTVTDELTITDEVAGSNYGRAADHAIAVASHLDTGAASWSGQALSVRGSATPDAVLDARETFRALGDAGLQGEFDVSSLLDSDSCNSAFAELLDSASIRFRTGSAEIDAGNADLLMRLATVASDCPGALTIAGHTDDQGDAALNESLSVARAGAVRDALSGLGIATDRMDAIGYGEMQPIADNRTPDGRAKNRRIVITVREPN